MYSRDFGGIRSEGQLYNFEREYNESRSRDDPTHERGNEPAQTEIAAVEKKTGFGLDFLRNLQLDDLILIGIGILLLLDSESENDIFVLIIALLVMF
jgi:hypothetical protein